MSSSCGTAVSFTKKCSVVISKYTLKTNASHEKGSRGWQNNNDLSLRALSRGTRGSVLYERSNLLFDHRNIFFLCCSRCTPQLYAVSHLSVGPTPINYFYRQAEGFLGRTKQKPRGMCAPVAEKTTRLKLTLLHTRQARPCSLNLRKYRFHISHEHASFFQDWIKLMKFIIRDEEMSRKKEKWIPPLFSLTFARFTYILNTINFIGFRFCNGYNLQRR